MKSILLSAIVLILGFVTSSVLSQSKTEVKCPTFQSVIPLKPSATSLNFSYAVVADGEYYLLDSHDLNRKNLKPKGYIPKDFNESRLITVVDKSDCNQSMEYYLIAIKSFEVSDDIFETNYTTLDLMKWESTTKWSEPKPLKQSPLFADNPYIRAITDLDPRISIEDLVHTIFYLDQTKTYFFVTKPLMTSDVLKSSSLRYYSVDSQESCDESYTYSKRSEKLNLALNEVLDGLDFCYFAQPLLYCVSGNLFQVNSIATQYKNGSIRTESIGSADTLPSIDRLKVMGSVCSIKKVSDTSDDRIRVRIEEIRVEEFESESEPLDKSFESSAPMNAVPNERLISEAKRVETSETPEEDSSCTFYIILICLSIFVVLMFVILVIAVRRQQRIAKM